MCKSVKKNKLLILNLKMTLNMLSINSFWKMCLQVKVSVRSVTSTEVLVQFPTQNR